MHPTFLQLRTCKNCHFALFYAVLIFTPSEGTHATQHLHTSGKSMRTWLGFSLVVREVASSILLICNAPRSAPGTPQTATRPPGDSPPRAAGLRLFFFYGPRIDSLIIRMRTLGVERRRCMALLERSFLFASNRRT